MTKLWGSFPDTGLEDQPSSEVLKKSSDEDLITRLFASVEKLEKRAKKMSAPQLYELQRKIGAATKKFQREVDAMLVRDRARKLAKAAKNPRTFRPGQKVKASNGGWVGGKVRRHLSATNVEVAFDT